MISINDINKMPFYFRHSTAVVHIEQRVSIFMSLQRTIKLTFLQQFGFYWYNLYLVLLIVLQIVKLDKKGLKNF